MLIKGLLYFNLELVKCQSRPFLLWSEIIEMSIKVFSSLIRNAKMLIKGLFYFNLELVKCWSRVISTLIQNCWNVDQRTSLLRFGIVEMLIKELLYFNPELLKCRPKDFSISIWNAEMLIKGLLYFNLELVKCRYRVFSTSIWNCRNVNQRSSLLQSGFVEMLIKGIFYFNLDCWDGN